MQATRANARRTDYTQPPPCPQCRKASGVRRVAALVRIPPRTTLLDQLLRGTDRPVVTIGLGGPAFPASRQQLPPSVARKLLPPYAPHDYRAQIDAHLTTIVNLGFLALLLYLAAHALHAVEGVDLAAGLLAWAGLGAAWLAAGIATGRLRQRTAERLADHERAMDRWRALFYCHDCQGAFAPGWRDCLPPDRVRAYVTGRAGRETSQQLGTDAR